MKNKYYVTTPIYYASGSLHIGHCFTTVIADAVSRYHKLQGDEVFFLTGSDEHGLKIQRNAEKCGLTPKEFVDKTVDGFKKVWSALNIDYDKFIRTTDKEHEKVVQDAFTKLYEKGDIYKSMYEGLYCVPCETFYTESQLVDGNCPACGRPVEKAKEESYFFKMSKYQSDIEKLFAENKNWLVPDSREHEIYKNFIEGGVEDLCVSRTTFDWGIKVPFDPKHVTYVWIDALLNYVSALGYGSEDDSNYKKFWPADVQFVGRDIARFHAVIWPILLKSLGIAMPKQIHSHGFLNFNGDKISKSKGGGIDPLVLTKRYTADAVRYWLLKDGPIYNDTPYSTELFLKTINSDLANDLGNLVSRTLAMIEQYFGGVLSEPKETEQDREIISLCESLNQKVENAMKTQRVDYSVNEIFGLVRYANKYIDLTTPWILAKTDKERLNTVLYNLYETLRVVAVNLQAFLPDTAEKIFAKLGIVDSKLKTLASTMKFDQTVYGNKVTKGEALFVRLDVAKEIDFLNSVTPNMEKSTEKNEEPKDENLSEAKAQITIDDFDKVELKLGKIIASERIEKADKLLKNTVQIGDEVRTIVSGIAKFYAPEEIVGKTVVVVTNLKPIKLRGVESYGMILCAVDEKNNALSLVSPEKDMPSGNGVC